MSAHLLLSIPGKLKALSDRLSSVWSAKLDTLATDYTTARAAKLDRLDVASSTLAPAASALSTAVWTPTLASNLALMTAAPISSIVKSVRHYSVNLAGTDQASETITAVTSLTKSIIIQTGVVCTDVTPDKVSVGIYFITTSTVRVIRGASGGVCDVYFTIVEFN